MAFLEAIMAQDLGIFLNNQDFSATQTMDEEFTQEITWRGAFGTDGPVLRTVRNADENTVSFSAVILRQGAARGLNSEDVVLAMRDFEVKTRKGDRVKTYRNCNWRRVAVRSTLTEAMLDCDISIPGFVRD